MKLLKFSSKTYWVIALTLGGISVFSFLALRGFLGIIGEPILYILNPWFLIFNLIPVFNRMLIDPFDFLSKITILITKIKWVGSYEIIDFIGIPVIIMLLQILFWRLLFYFNNWASLDYSAKRNEKRILFFTSISVMFVILSAITLAIYEDYYSEQLKIRITTKTFNNIKSVLDTGDINYCRPIPIKEPHGLDIQLICYFIGALVIRDFSICSDLIDSDLCIKYVGELKNNQLSSKTCEYNLSIDPNGEISRSCSLYLGIYFQDKSLCDKAGYKSWMCYPYIISR